MLDCHRRLHVVHPNLPILQPLATRHSKVRSDLASSRLAGISKVSFLVLPYNSNAGLVRLNVWGLDLVKLKTKSGTG